MTAGVMAAPARILRSATSARRVSRPGRLDFHGGICARVERRRASLSVVNLEIESRGNKSSGCVMGVLGVGAYACGGQEVGVLRVQVIFTPKESVAAFTCMRLLGPKQFRGC